MHGTAVITPRISLRCANEWDGLIALVDLLSARNRYGNLSPLSRGYMSCDTLTGYKEDSSFAQAHFIAIAASVLLAFAQSPMAQSPTYDLVLRNGRIVDGSGSPWYRGDVAIRGDAIVRVGPAITDSATRVIDVEGQVIAPALSTFTLTLVAASLKCPPPRITCDKVSRL